MQGIYTYIPETNYVPREYNVAAILLLLFIVLISLVSVLNLLYFYISTFRSMCAVPNMTVFWSSFIVCFPGMFIIIIIIIIITTTIISQDSQFRVVDSSNGKQYKAYTRLTETGLPLDSPRLTDKQCQESKIGLDTINVFDSAHSVSFD